MGEACSTHVRGNFIQNFFSEHQKKRTFGKSRHVWVFDIKVCPKGLVCGSVQWMQLFWKSYLKVHVNMAVKLWVPQKERNFLNSWDNCDFCRVEFARAMCIGRSAAVTCHCQQHALYTMWCNLSVCTRHQFVYQIYLVSFCNLLTVCPCYLVDKLSGNLTAINVYSSVTWCCL